MKTQIAKCQNETHEPHSPDKLSKAHENNEKKNAAEGKGKEKNAMNIETLRIIGNFQLMGGSIALAFPLSFFLSSLLAFSFACKSLEIVWLPKDKQNTELYQLLCFPLNGKAQWKWIGLQFKPSIYLPFMVM